METGLKITTKDGTPNADATLYKRLVGSLIHTTKNRPNITYVVGILERHMTDPKKSHYIAIVRVLKYLNTTTKYGLLFERNKDFRLIAYSDSNFGGDKDTGRSTSRYATFLGKSPTSWRSKR